MGSFDNKHQQSTSFDNKHQHSTKNDKFRFPTQPKQVEATCNHFLCKPGQPCRSSRSESPSRSTTKMHCSPQLQKVVLHAVNQFPNQKENNKYDWRPKNYPKSQLKGTIV